MKKQLLSLAIVALFASNAYASKPQEATLLPGIVASAQSQAVDATPALNALDMQAAFQQDKQPMQVAALSGQEMKTTEGAWGWASAIIAVTQYVNNYWGRTSGSTHDQAVSAGIGNVLTGTSIVNAFL